MSVKFTNQGGSRFDGNGGSALHGNQHRAQVKAETEAAMRQGLLSYGESNYPMPVPNVGPGKTRQQVINEMLNESPAERSERLRLYSPG